MRQIFNRKVQMELVVNIDENKKLGHSAVCVQSSRSNAVVVENAELRAGPTFGQGLYLVVSGPMPENRGQVKLVPDLAEHNPEYRKIEIICDDQAAANNDIPIAIEKYEKSIPLSGLSGTQGIELLGANGTMKFDLMG